MKNVKVISFGLWVIGMLLVSVPTMAQQQEWKSTSTMQGTGSSYAPQISAVGATTVSEMATTTESYSPAKVGPRRSKDDPGEVEPFIDPGSPIGDALIPLLVMSLAFGGYVAIRRKRLAEQASR